MKQHSKQSNSTQSKSGQTINLQSVLTTVNIGKTVQIASISMPKNAAYPNRNNPHKNVVERVNAGQNNLLMFLVKYGQCRDNKKQPFLHTCGERQTLRNRYPIRWGERERWVMSKWGQLTFYLYATLRMHRRDCWASEPTCVCWLTLTICP